MEDPLNFLIIGDAHVPDRVSSIPIGLERTIKMLMKGFPKGYFDEVFYTGDFTDSNHLFDLLLNACGRNLQSLHAVMGNMDYFSNARGKVKKLHRDEEFIEDIPMMNKNNNECGGIRIGLHHGHRIRPRGNHMALLKYAKERSLNILLTGHTHADDIALLSNNILLVNPGSCTGAWSFLSTGQSSFIHMVIERDIDANENDIPRKIREKDCLALIEINLYYVDDLLREYPDIKKRYIYTSNRFYEI